MLTEHDMMYKHFRITWIGLWFNSVITQNLEMAELVLKGYNHAHIYTIGPI